VFCIPVSNPPQKDVNSVNDTICLPGSCNESGVILQHPHLSIYDYNPHSLDIGDIRKAVVLWILFKSIPFPSRARDFQVHFIHTWVQHKKIRSSLFSLITNTFLFDDDENTISLEPKRIREWKMLCKKLGERRSMLVLIPITRHRNMITWLVRFVLCKFIKKYVLFKRSFERYFDLRLFFHSVYRVLSCFRNIINTKGWLYFIMHTNSPNHVTNMSLDEVISAMTTHTQSLYVKQITLAPNVRINTTTSASAKMIKQMYKHNEQSFFDAVFSFGRKLVGVDAQKTLVDGGMSLNNVGCLGSRLDLIYDSHEKILEYQLSRCAVIDQTPKFKARQFSTKVKHAIDIHHAKILNIMILGRYAKTRFSTTPPPSDVLRWLTSFGASEKCISQLTHLAEQMPTVDTKFETAMFQCSENTPHTFSLVLYCAELFNRFSKIKYFSIKLPRYYEHEDRPNIWSRHHTIWHPYEIRICHQCLKVYTSQCRKDEGYKLIFTNDSPGIKSFCTHMNVVPHMYFKSTRLIRFSLWDSVLVIGQTCHFWCRQHNCGRISVLDTEICTFNHMGWACVKCTQLLT